MAASLPSPTSVRVRGRYPSRTPSCEVGSHSARTPPRSSRPPRSTARNAAMASGSVQPNATVSRPCCPGHHPAHSVVVGGLLEREASRPLGSGADGSPSAPSAWSDGPSRLHPVPRRVRRPRLRGARPALGRMRRRTGVENATHFDMLAARRAGSTGSTGRPRASRVPSGHPPSGSATEGAAASMRGKLDAASRRSAR